MTRLLIRVGKLPYERVDPFTTLVRNVTGTNVGNMLFQEAVVKALSLPQNEIASNGYDLELSNVERINESCDVLVLPLANQFRPNFAHRLAVMAKTIRRLKVKVVVVGVGCQTDLDYDLAKLDPIRQEVKDFVAAVLDHSTSIGVRGECTAEYLRTLGFKSVEVIGCPSMFMHGPELTRPRPIDTFDRNTRLSVNISAAGKQAKFSTGLDKMGGVIARAVSWYDDIECVPQQRDSLRALLLGTAHRTHEQRAIPKSTYRKLYDAGRVTAFVDPRTWIEHLSERDFVFGTRLHGGVAAILAGTPAHLIAHDSRTLELARYHQIPHATIRSLSVDQNPADYYDPNAYDDMISGHAERFAVFARFLKANGLHNVFRHGDGGAAFDARMSAVDLPPAIVSGMKLRQRLPWVREHVASVTGRAHESPKRLAV
jgi:hypothetical protein